MEEGAFSDSAAFSCSSAFSALTSCLAWASNCAAWAATARSCSEGSRGARAARFTVWALRTVASGSPGTGDASMDTSPPTAYCLPSGPVWNSNVGHHWHRGPQRQDVPAHGLALRHPAPGAHSVSGALLQIILNWFWGRLRRLGHLVLPLLFLPRFLPHRFWIHRWQARGVPETG